MNSRDRNGLYGGGSITPCSSDRKQACRSSKTSTTRAVALSGSDLTTISRPKSLRSTYARMRYAKIASMLVICAVATIAISAIAHASVDSQKGTAPAPGPPYLLWGFVTDSGGGPAACTVTITNLRTTEVGVTTSDPTDGYYEFDLQNQLPSAYQVGDLINVTAVSGTSIGWNQMAVPGGGSMWMDVTLTGTVGIPEFPMAVLPVVGMMALFALVRLKRKGDGQ